MNRHSSCDVAIVNPVRHNRHYNTVSMVRFIHCQVWIHVLINLLSQLFVIVMNYSRVFYTWHFSTLHDSTSTVHCISSCINMAFVFQLTLLHIVCVTFRMYSCHIFVLKFRIVISNCNLVLFVFLLLMLHIVHVFQMCFCYICVELINLLGM